jgi:hypothetical protein
MLNRPSVRGLVSALVLLCLGIWQWALRIVDWAGRGDTLVTISRHLPGWLAVLSHPITGLLLIISGFTILVYLARQRERRDSVLILPYERPQRPRAWNHIIATRRHPILIVATASILAGSVLAIATWLAVRNAYGASQEELGTAIVEFHEKGFVPGSDRDFFKEGDKKGPVTIHRLFLNEVPGALKVMIATHVEFAHPPAKVDIQQAGYFNFDSRVKFIGIYIPRTDPETMFRICGNFCFNYKQRLETLDRRMNLSLETGGIPGAVTSQELVSSGRLLVYHETKIPKDDLSELDQYCTSNGVSLQSRGPEYLASGAQ